MVKHSELFGKLPLNFAEKVLDLEFKIENSPKITDIRKLVELYSKAVEHYEAQKDSKYTKYQKRLKDLLCRKEVIACMQGPLQPTDKANRVPAETTETFLKTHSKNTQQATLLTQKNLAEQENFLQSRVEKRRYQFERIYEEELNKIVEHFVSLKYESIQRVKQTYEEQIKEMKTYGNNSIVSEVVKELEKSMLQEIHTVAAQVDGQRSTSILQLKSKI